MASAGYSRFKKSSCTETVSVQIVLFFEIGHFNFSKSILRDIFHAKLQSC